MTQASAVDMPDARQRASAWWRSEIRWMELGLIDRSVARRAKSDSVSSRRTSALVDRGFRPMRLRSISKSSGAPVCLKPGPIQVTRPYHDPLWVARSQGATGTVHANVIKVWATGSNFQSLSHTLKKLHKICEGPGRRERPPHRRGWGWAYGVPEIFRASSVAPTWGTGYDDHTIHFGFPEGFG